MATQSEPTRQASSFEQLLQLLMTHGWSLPSNAQLRLKIPPAQAYNVLEIAMKPSVNRLGLRKLFTRGRRYFIRAKTETTFEMMTTSKVWWHPKRRTEPSAVLTGEFEQVDETLTRLKLNSRIRFRYLMGGVLWPAFITSIIVFVDWSLLLIIACIMGMFITSLVERRYNAMLDAHYISYFIQTILSDFEPDPAPLLSSEGADIVIEDDFSVEWEKYMEDHKND